MKVYELFDELHFSDHFICYSSCDGRVLFKTYGKKYKKYLNNKINKMWVSIITDTHKYSHKNIGYATLCFSVTPLEEDLPKRLRGKV